MKAMIFAAGEGTRLRPLTERCPKALIEVGGRPMIDWAIRGVIAAGARRVVVNVHHLAAQIAEYLSAATYEVEILVSDETSRLLDTGGGLLKARRLLGADSDSEPILLHNADILTDLDLNRLKLKGDATLLVSERPTSRLLAFSPETHRLSGWVNTVSGEIRGDAGGLRRAFNGVHIVSPSIFPALERYSRAVGSDVFSLTPFYVSQAEEMQIYGEELGGYRWHDIGTPEKLAAAMADFGQ